MRWEWLTYIMDINDTDEMLVNNNLYLDIWTVTKYKANNTYLNCYSIGFYNHVYNGSGKTILIPQLN